MSGGFCFLLISVSGNHFPTFRVIFPTFKNSKPASYSRTEKCAGFSWDLPDPAPGFLHQMRVSPEA
jgi:hypothetical protein